MTGQDDAPRVPAPDAGEGEPTLEGAFAQDGTDLTLIVRALGMTPTERLAMLQDMADFTALVRDRDED